MALGALQKIPENVANRLSFHMENEDDDMLSDSSPCKTFRMPYLSMDSASSQRLQSSTAESDRLELPRLVFRDPFNESTESMHSVSSFESIGSFGKTPRTSESLIPTCSSELVSEVSTTPRNGSMIEEEFDFGKENRQASSGTFSFGLSPGGDDFDKTPINRTGLLRSSRYHRVNHSTIGIPVNGVSGPLIDARREQEPISPRKSTKSSQRPPSWMLSPRVRRTQSMFATPEQMMHDLNSDPANKLPAGGFSGASVLESPQCPVPTFTVRHDPFPRISVDTLCRLLDREFTQIYSAVVVIDCRFEYEYEGGHINGAINVNSKPQLEDALFSNCSTMPNSRVLLVFHCEHSAYRSPMLASHLRHCDRDANASRYPSLFYPDVAVLDGGYSEFYFAAASRCVPQNYVGMNHKEHEQTCEREMSRFRSGMKSRKFSSGGMKSSPDLGSFRFPTNEVVPPPPSERSASVAEPVKSIFNFV